MKRLASVLRRAADRIDPPAAVGARAGFNDFKVYANPDDWGRYVQRREAQKYSARP